MSDITTSPDSSEVNARVPKRILSGYPAYVFWVMFSINFLNYLDRNVLTGAANVVAKELGFGFDGIGYIASAFLIVYTLGTVPLGIWADRAKRRNVVAICVAVWSVATALTALANSFITLFLSRMVLGIGEAGYFPAGTALMSDYFRRSTRSRVMSWWSVGQLVGILVGFVVGGTVAGLFIGSWRLAFIFTGIPGLILAFLAWRVREPRRNQADEAVGPDSHSFGNATELEEPPHTLHITSSIFAQFRTLLSIKTLVVLIVMQIFAFFVLGVNVVFLPTYLQQKDTFGLTSGQAGLFSGAVIVFAGMAGTILGGYLADVLNRRHPGARVLVCGIGFLLSAPSFAVAVTVHDLRIFSIFFILTTLLILFYQGPSTAATQDVVPSILRASAVALTLLIAHLLGDAFAPSLVGTLATVFDPTHGLHFKNSVGGQDLSHALLITCTPALVIAGLVGIFGARWMKADVDAAEQADRALNNAG
ncbi:MAG TPA: MFS transporter [Ktedonobacteraceae bacterium]|nr:MFS transporter [Ktedonobacteraceae bacterium]